MNLFRTRHDGAARVRLVLAGSAVAAALSLWLVLGRGEPRPAGSGEPAQTTEHRTTEHRADGRDALPAEGEGRGVAASGGPQRSALVPRSPGDALDAPWRLLLAVLGWGAAAALGFLGADRALARRGPTPSRRAAADRARGGTAGDVPAIRATRGA